MNKGNFKMKCIKAYQDYTTKGKIYEVKDGEWMYDNGEITHTNAQTIEDINRQYISKFESIKPVLNDENVTLLINNQLVNIALAVETKSPYKDTEKEIMDSLINAWNLFVKLEKTHPDEVADFKDGIHKCQCCLAMRTMRRDYPEVYPTSTK